MNLGIIVYSRSKEVDRSQYKSSWYPYDFDAGLVNCVGANVEPGQKRLNDGAALADHKHPERLGISLEGALMSLLEMKSHGRQFLATRYPADLE